MGGMITFDCLGGGSANGYMAEAPGARSGLIVLQEWWGLNDQIKGVADRYSALAPDLYDGHHYLGF